MFMLISLLEVCLEWGVKKGCTLRTLRIPDQRHGGQGRSWCHEWCFLPRGRYPEKDDRSCTQFVLEQGVSPEDNLQLANCRWTLNKMLKEVVDNSIHTYNTPYPWFTDLGHLVSHSYKECPHCHHPQSKLITDMIGRLEANIIADNVPLPGSKEGVRMEFDHRTLVAAITAAFPEAMVSSLSDWENRAKELIFFWWGNSNFDPNNVGSLWQWMYYRVL